jgi:2-polyprenyl-3-methyl-5-hydroxy-6-metoxy-1,4-benzoquinol methylase
MSCQNENRHRESFKDRERSYIQDSLAGTVPSNFEEIVTTYEDPDRKDWQNPSLVIEKLGELKNKTVADIGAGTGYFSFRLAQEGARVIAIDIDPQFLTYIEERQEEVLSSSDTPLVTTRLSRTDDPLLSPGEADVVLLVNTYTYIEDRISYLQKVKKGMSEEGKLAIVDYKDETNPVSPDTQSLLAPEIVQAELEQAGFTDVVIDESSLQYQYIIIAKKRSI